MKKVYGVKLARSIEESRQGLEQEKYAKLGMQLNLTSQTTAQQRTHIAVLISTTAEIQTAQEIAFGAILLIHPQDGSTALLLMMRWKQRLLNLNQSIWKLSMRKTKAKAIEEVST